MRASLHSSAVLLLTLTLFPACDKGSSSDSASTDRQVQAPASLLMCFTDLACPYLTSIAHRGAARFAPENTLAAFEKAAELGADGVEMDVRTTMDGALVLMHDGDVDRTTHGTGQVSELTLAEIQALTVPSAFDGVPDQQVPTFRESLELARELGLGVDVDVKEASGEDLAREIEAADMLPYVFLNTGSVAEGHSFREANAAMAIMPSVSEPKEIPTYKELSPELIEVDCLDLPGIAPQVQSAGARLFTQTLGFEIGWVGAENHQAQWAALLDAGVLVLQTDYPELLGPILQERNQAIAAAGATWTGE